MKTINVTPWIGQKSLRASSSPLISSLGGDITELPRRSPLRSSLLTGRSLIAVILADSMISFPNYFYRQFFGIWQFLDEKWCADSMECYRYLRNIQRSPLRNLHFFPVGPSVTWFLPDSMISSMTFLKTWNLAHPVKTHHGVIVLQRHIDPRQKWHC